MKQQQRREICHQARVYIWLRINMVKKVPGSVTFTIQLFVAHMWQNDLRTHIYVNSSSDFITKFYICLLSVSIINCLVGAYIFCLAQKLCIINEWNHGNRIYLKAQSFWKYIVANTVTHTHPTEPNIDTQISKHYTSVWGEINSNDIVEETYDYSDWWFSYIVYSVQQLGINTIIDNM